MEGMREYIVMKSKGFASIEVLLVSLACSFIVTILMENSFTKREVIERKGKNNMMNLNYFYEEEEFIKTIVENNDINSENIKSLEVKLDNKLANYDEENNALKISIKNKVTGVFKNTYYDFRFNEENKIILSKRRYYDFT